MCIDAENVYLVCLYLPRYFVNRRCYLQSSETNGMYLGCSLVCMKSTRGTLSFSQDQLFRDESHWHVKCLTSLNIH